MSKNNNSINTESNITSSTNENQSSDPLSLGQEKPYPRVENIEIVCESQCSDSSIHSISVNVDQRERFLFIAPIKNYSVTPEEPSFILKTVGLFLFVYVIVIALRAWFSRADE